MNPDTESPEQQEISEDGFACDLPRILAIEEEERRGRERGINARLRSRPCRQLRKSIYPLSIRLFDQYLLARIRETSAERSVIFTERDCRIIQLD